MTTPHFLIIGAGFSGAVLARELVEAMGCRVTLWDERDHLAGNSHTERDAATGVMVHRYGPHIFNTNSQRVWDYVNRFSRFGLYLNRVKVSLPQGIFSFPINLHTINQFFGLRLNPREAREFIASKADASIREPRNFEEQALSLLGEEIYRAFFYGYTRKAWGCEPRELPASILKRLPVRFNYSDVYYDKTFQGIPVDGYTVLIERMLDHPAIEVKLSRPFASGMDRSGWDHVFYTGALDAFFNHAHGRLSYRTVTFERIEAEGDYQGNAVLNYPGLEVPYVRVHEHKHFTPWETHERTVAFREYNRETGPGDVPYYPKRLEADLIKLREYRQLAAQTPGCSFLGRLATYRYLDMERVVDEALDFSRQFVKAFQTRQPLPIFPNDIP